MSAVELHTGNTGSRSWHEGESIPNPLPFGPNALHIVYSASADLGFALAADWGLPHHVLDLWVEYRNLTNGLLDNQGEKLETSLLEACHARGVWDTTPEAEKEANRERIISGFPFSPEEMRRIVDYCAGDVRMTRELASRLVPEIQNLDQALHRGRCAKAIVCVEWNGTPVDIELYSRLRSNSREIQNRVTRIFEDEHELGLFATDKKGVLHQPKANFTAWIRRMGFDESTWPFNGKYASADDKEVMEQMAVLHADRFPEIESYRQLKKFLSIAKSEFKFPIGPDGRNRSQMLPYIGSASRSQPRTSENIGNATKPIRALLAPHRGQVLMHRDMSNAEYGISAALAGDKKRWENYLYRDAYLVKAADFGFCDYRATKETHRELRNKFKPVALAGQYGQTPQGLSRVLGIKVKEAETFMERERRQYPVYEAWKAANDEDRAFNGYVETELGFRLWVPLDTTRSIRSGNNAHLLRRALNHPMQGNCAEILRYWCCLLTERGVDVCNTVHDAIFYVAPEGCWQDVDAVVADCLREACEFVLGDDYILKSDRDVVLYSADGYRYDPETKLHYGHYQHEDGKKMWNRIEAALLQLEAEVSNVKTEVVQ
jgi:DNA polymerase I-like protein with 3'-5' exonuclease and polymerase domains